MGMVYNSRSGNNEILHHDSDSGGTLNAIMDGCCCILCNRCSPDLMHDYVVTMAGLAGDLAGFNGAHAATHAGHVDPCEYDVDSTDAGAMFWTGFNWKIRWAVQTVSFCTIDFIGPTTACAPTGTYTINTCLDSSCSDTNTCVNSVGATIVVS